MEGLLELTSRGLYCPRGDFHVDPWSAVDSAVITHAHADHARRGSRRYLTSDEGRHVLASRMDPDAEIDAAPYGETRLINGVKVSLHPAGHILGSAQVRIESRGQVCVVSGDYKTDGDPTCRSFEPIRCHTFISEATFGLPLYRWPVQSSVLDDLNRWWSQNAEEGRASIVYAYSLGKAQRVLAGLDPSIGPIVCHGAVEQLNRAYRETGIPLPDTHLSLDEGGDWKGRRALAIAPPSVQGSGWLKRFGDYDEAFVSGWMLVRGTRRRRSVGRGFVLSDHADWPGLLSAIDATEAEQVYLTHGNVEPMVRWLREQGYRVDALATRFTGESDDAERTEPSDGEVEAPSQGNERE